MRPTTESVSLSSQIAKARLTLRMSGLTQTPQTGIEPLLTSYQRASTNVSLLLSLIRPQLELKRYGMVLEPPQQDAITPLISVNAIGTCREHD